MPPAMPIPIPTSTTGKRQRDPSPDRISSEPSVDENGDIDMRLPPTRTPAISPELLSGESVPAINPLTGQRTQPGSQVTQWVESKLEERLATARQEPPNQVDGSDSPRVKRKRGSQQSSADSTNFVTALTPATSSGLEAPQPDEFTQALGVGWTRLGDDPDVVAAVRGYCRYIENHYPLTNVEILVKSRSLDSYLVKTSGGYYLFNEDLSEGKLIAREFTATLAYLQGSRIQCEGTGPIYAATAAGISTSNCKEAEASVMEVADAAGDVHMT